MNKRQIILFISSLLFIYACIDERFDPSSSFDPSVEFLNPKNGREYGPGDTINFSARITDKNTEPFDISFKLRSNIDGVIRTGTVSLDNKINIKETLTRGIHTITLSATDKDDNIGKSSITLNVTLPKGVILDNPQKINKTIILNWSEYINDNFVKYEVYRNNEDDITSQDELLATITNKSIITFTDTTPPLKMLVSYYIKVYDNEENSNISNVRFVKNPAGVIMLIDPTVFLSHPTKPWLFIFDSNKQIFYKYDYEADEILDELELPFNVNYCNIGDNGYGVELYVSNRDGGIYIYSPEDFTQLEIIPTTDPCESIEINGSGIIIASLYYYGWENINPVGTYNRITGEFIDKESSSEAVNIKKRPTTTNEFISIELHTSTSTIEYYMIDATGIFISHSQITYYDYNINPDVFSISSDGSYFIASANGNIFSADSNLEYIGSLPDNGLIDFEFNDDGSLIYSPKYNTKYVKVFSYPSLTYLYDIETKEYAKKIIKKGSQLLLLSKVSDSYYEYFIEIIDI